MSAGNGKAPAAQAAGATIYWAALMERSVQEQGVLALMRVAEYNGRFANFKQMQTPYQRTDMARNNLVATFLEVSTHPHDALVMLDCDHIHPHDVVAKLARHDPERVGVIGAQAHRRGAPFDMCAFIRVGARLHTIAEWERGAVIPCVIVGTGAILIRRWVFDRLGEAGVQPPFFRYAYQDGSRQQPTEDVHFGLACEHAGVAHHVDTSVQIPHLIAGTVDEDSWLAWMADNPGTTVEVTDDLGNGQMVTSHPDPAPYQVPDLTLRVED